MTDALVLLVLIWAVLLVPSAMKSRRSSPHVTVGGFERAMNVLSGNGGVGSRELFVPSDAGRIVGHGQVDGSPGQQIRPGSQAMPNNENPLIARRRSRFERSLMGVAATFVLALVFGGWLWPLFVVTAAGTGGYVAILRHLKLQRDEAHRVVRELDLSVDTEEEAAPVAVGGGIATDSSSVRLRRWED